MLIRDILGEIKNNPKWIYITVTMIVVGVLITATTFMDFSSSKTKLSLSDEERLAPDEGIPDDMFQVWKKETPPPPPPPEPAKKLEKITLNINDIIKLEQKIEPSLSREEILRRELLKQRTRKGKTQVIERAVKKPHVQKEQIIADISQDDDFSRHGLSKSIPTYPVDLSRTLTADRFIPAVLITEVKSELPSAKVLAQIETDVYAAHGEKILIPKGSKAIGSYEPLAEVDSKRLMIAWHRIITPEGINIKLQSETADGEGSAGQTGRLDNRLLDKYGTALLFSSISALAQLTISTENESQSAAAEAFSGEFGTITAESLRNSLDILPRVTIPQGGRLKISPLEDIWFSEPVYNQAEVIPMKEFQDGGKVEPARFQRGFDASDGRPIFMSEDDLLMTEMEDMSDSLPNSNDMPVEFKETYSFSRENRGFTDYFR